MATTSNAVVAGNSHKGAVIDANPLVGASSSQLQLEDDILSSLSRVAYSDGVKEAPSTAKKGRFGTRTSRFWFKVESIHDHIQQQKRIFRPPQMEHVDEAVVKRLKSYKDELPAALKANIEAIREFFLMEVAPLTLAASGGTAQSKDVIQRFLKTTVDTAMIAKFDNMVNRAATIKLGLFVLEYFKLPPEHLPSLFGTPHNPEADVMSKIMTALQQLPTREEVRSQLRSVKKAPNGKKADEARAFK